MKIFVAHASAFEYEQKLYEPIRASELAQMHEFILPEEQKYKGTWNTKEVIGSCDLLIVDVSLPSTGAGIEMGWANAFQIPIVAIYEKGSMPSTVIKYVTKTSFEYDSPADLVTKLSQALTDIK